MTHHVAVTAEQAFEIVRDCLSSTLNRGTWFTTQGLANATGLHAADVLEGLYILDRRNLIECRPVAHSVIFEYRKV